MNLLFWNLAKNNNCKRFAALIKEKAVDIGIVAEFQGTDLNETVKDLEPSYALEKGKGGCTKIALIAKKKILISVFREATRYVIYSCKTRESTYIIVAVHLPANPSAGPAERKAVIRVLVGDIEEAETTLQCVNTIITGDFNASPFDSELVGKDSFNAVLYKDLIRRKENVTFAGQQYKRFYNPMINYISEGTRNYGSFYYSQGINSLYWFCYDQVIVRKSLIDRIDSVTYCKKIQSENLSHKVTPNGEISDHLPLFFKLTEEF